MGYFAVFLIALSLAMDALAVSVTNGIVITDFKRRHAVKMGAYFGVFQFVMPIIGFILGTGFRRLIESYDHWIAFGLLGIIGVNMIIETIKEEEVATVTTAAVQLRPSKLTLMAVATSIDALAVGISFAAMGDENIVPKSLIIGIVAFVLSFAGGCFGRKLGELFQKSAQRIGGLILIGIGVKILIEHIG